jgi:hypothetical protein
MGIHQSRVKIQSSEIYRVIYLFIIIIHGWNFVIDVGHLFQLEKACRVISMTKRRLRTHTLAQQGEDLANEGSLATSLTLVRCHKRREPHSPTDLCKWRPPA